MQPTTTDPATPVTVIREWGGWISAAIVSLLGVRQLKKIKDADIDERAQAIVTAIVNDPDGRIAKMDAKLDNYHIELREMSAVFQKHMDDADDGFKQLRMHSERLATIETEIKMRRHSG